MDITALTKISYGLYVISSRNGEKFSGQIANTVFQTTAEPPTVAISINKKNLTHEFIESSSLFTVSILSKATPMTFIGLFGFRSGRDIDKFRDVQYEIGKTGAPVALDNAIAYMECEVSNKMDAGSHTVFIGKVVDAHIIRDEEPLTYDYYHRVLKGKAPKTAATYIKEEVAKEDTKEVSMTKYVCTVCGYVYDPRKGDPDSGIPPGTSFEDLPDDWVCPVCGAGKDQFEGTE